MRWLILIKQVPDTYGPRGFNEQKRVDRASGEQVLDEIGERCLELALGHRDDHHPDDEVVAVTMGPPSANDVIREALSMGADRAAHLCDDSLIGADQIQTGVALAALLRGEEPDVIVAGHASSDGNGGVVPALIAQQLGIPLLSDLMTVEVGDREISGTRILGSGTQSVRADLPAIVTVTDQLPEGRVATLRGVFKARKKPSADKSLNDLGITSTGPTTAVTTVARRPPHSRGVTVSEQDDAVPKLMDLLVERGLL